MCKNLLKLNNKKISSLNETCANIWTDISPVGNFQYHMAWETDNENHSEVTE